MNNEHRSRLLIVEIPEKGVNAKRYGFMNDDNSDLISSRLDGPALIYVYGIHSGPGQSFKLSSWFVGGTVEKSDATLY